jgi:polysaccharide biosynthesis protein PslH
MKILVIFPGQIYPIKGMSQVRVINQIKAFALDHKVILTDLVSTPQQKQICKESLSEFVDSYQPIERLNYGKSKLFRVLHFIYRKIVYALSSLRMEEISVCSKYIQTQILRTATENQVDAILIHYWYMGFFFKHVPKNVLKIIDTHYVVEEDLELEDKYKGQFLKTYRIMKEIRHNLKQQRQYFCLADLVVVNSAKQEKLIHAWQKDIPVNVTVNGQDLAQYFSYKLESPQPNTLLFYGALANPFNRMALERILSGILPVMRKSKPDVILYVVGNDPPQDILSKYDMNNIVVTGHVDDVMPYISRAQVLLLPLDIAVGFRGRIVEVLSLGVPVVGTENALQSVDFVSGKHGFIAESDKEIAEKALLIISNQELRSKMSHACIEHAKNNFSLEETFGKLSKLLIDLKPN